MLRSFFNEFKKFAMRGNVIDMAVGIIIGAAFGKIVDSLVKDIIMPPIGLLIGSMDFSNLFFVLKDVPGHHGAYASLAQAAQAFENIKTVLGELGADTADVLKTTVYLTNMADFGEVNKLYTEVFGPDYPARTCVEVSALPMGLSIEVECIARAK